MDVLVPCVAIVVAIMLWAILYARKFLWKLDDLKGHRPPLTPVPVPGYVPPGSSLEPVHLPAMRCTSQRTIPYEKLTHMDQATSDAMCERLKAEAIATVQALLPDARIRTEYTSDDLNALVVITAIGTVGADA